MLLQVAFAMVCLLLGGSAGYAAGLFKIGWWFSDELDAEQAKKSLQDLEDLTTRVTGQVAAHARKVEDVQRELDAQGESEGNDPVAVAAEMLRSANEELQAELRKAKRDLEKQASELQSHRREARTDVLTQLLNRRAFDEEMDRLPQRIAATRSDAALLMFDIDHFKSFNDTYGHQLGDRVIKQVADAVRQTLTGMDVVAARYGGEEFAIILASGSAAMASRVAEELRAAVERHAIKHEGESLSVTISLGLAMTATGLDPEETIARADEALYAAKGAGRNRGYYHELGQNLPMAALIAGKGTSAAAPPIQETARSVAPHSASPLLTSPEMEEVLLEASLDIARREALSERADRRKHERRPYTRSHLIAPIVGGRLPAPEMFEEVRFFDLSTSGFGMLQLVPPPNKNFVVALDKADGVVYALAEVVRMRRSEEVDARGRRMWEIGCRFTGKLQSYEAAALAAAYSE